MKYHKCVSRLRNGLNKEFRTSCKHKWKKYILVKYKTLYIRHNTWIVQLYIRSQWYYKEHMIGLKIQCLKKSRQTNKLKTSKFESFLIAVTANCRKTWAANSPTFGTFIVKYILFLAFVLSTAQHWHLVQALKVYLSLHLVVKNTEIRLGWALCQNFTKFVKYLMPHFKEVNYDI